MLTDAYVPWPVGPIKSGGRRQWQSVTENHDGVCEPEYLAEMYVSLDYSIRLFIIYITVFILRYNIPVAKPQKAGRSLTDGVYITILWPSQLPNPSLFKKIFSPFCQKKQ